MVYMLIGMGVRTYMISHMDTRSVCHMSSLDCSLPLLGRHAL